MTMKCSEAQELLSAYYDGELASSIRTKVQEHIEKCEACQAELGQFESLSMVAGELREFSMPTSVWSGIKSKNDSQSVTEQAIVDRMDGNRTNGLRILPTHLSRRRLVQYAAALAATLLLGLVGMEMWMHGDHDHAEMAKAMEQVADEIDSDKATHLLLNKYGGSEVSYQDAITQVGYKPVASDGLPTGYSVEGLQVLDMPCCKCTQTACRRPDNSRFFIFEHSNEEPGWFEHRKKRQCQCGDNSCEVVELDNQLVATWKKGNRHVTVLGARDEEEIELLAKHFDKSS
jgi:anti-sigma factor RsiW